MGMTPFPHGLTSFGIPVFGNYPGMGKPIFCVTAKTSSDIYYNWLRQNKVPDGSIFATLNLAYADAVTGRNDTIFIFPGVHTLSADLTWAKAHTHLYGVGGPIIEGDSYTDGIVVTSGASGTTSLKTMYITGAQNQFYGVLFEQPQAAATAVTACKVAGPSNWFKNCGFIGMMNATQDTGTTLSSLEIGPSSQYLRFEDCVIGSPLWYNRTAINGQILFSNSSAATCPQDIVFKDCRILNISATATNPAVRLTSNYAMDRLLEFRDCTFYNFQESTGTPLTSGVFLDGCGTSHRILLTGNTAQYGWHNWADVHTYIFCSSPAGSATGGLAIVTT